MRVVLVLCLMSTPVLGQTSYFNQGLLRQGTADLDLRYLGAASSNSVFNASNYLWGLIAGIPPGPFVLRGGDTMTGSLVMQTGGIFSGDGSGLTNLPSAGIVWDGGASDINMGFLTNIDTVEAAGVAAQFFFGDGTGISNVPVTLAQLPAGVLTNFDTRSWTNSNTTDATSPTSASALKTGGGLSVAKQIFSGSNGFFGGTVSATNGAYVGMNANGGIAPANSVSPLGAWGFMSLTNSQNINVLVSGTYYNIINFNYAYTNSFGASMTGGYLTNTIAGWYRIALNVSCIAPSPSDSMDADVTINDVVDERIASHTTAPSGAGKYVSMSASGVLYLSAGTRISIGITDTSATGNIGVLHAQLSVGTP